MFNRFDEKGLAWPYKQDFNVSENGEVDALVLTFLAAGREKSEFEISHEDGALFVLVSAASDFDEDEFLANDGLIKHSSLDYFTKSGGVLKFDISKEIYKIDELKASLKNGILKVTIPFVEGKKATTFEITEGE